MKDYTKRFGQGKLLVENFCVRKDLFALWINIADMNLTADSIIARLPSCRGKGTGKDQKRFIGYRMSLHVAQLMEGIVRFVPVCSKQLIDFYYRITPLKPMGKWFKWTLPKPRLSPKSKKSSPPLQMTAQRRRHLFPTSSTHSQN